MSAEKHRELSIVKNSGIAIKKMRSRKRGKHVMRMNQLIAGALLAGSVTLTVQAGEKPGKGVTVQPIQSTIVEEKFQTLLVGEALRELGYAVKGIQEASYNTAFTAVANGDATFMAVGWDPLHDTMYKNAGGDEAFYRKGDYVNGAAQGYLIDKKTAEKHDIDNIEDFSKPEIARLFDTNGNGKADLTGCESGWGCEGVIEHQLDAFNLRDGIDHNQGSYTATIADTIARYKKGEPIFYYTWTPFWVSGVLVPGDDVVWLEVPRSANPNGANTELPNGRNYGFQINDQRIVANAQWAAKNPAAARLFEVMTLSANDISAQNMKVRNGEDSRKEIMGHTQAWIEAHRDKFSGWLEKARAAAE
jgi:glycine betaine/proline transport system substrate-binding protein